jgi:hypothetical protein
MPWVAAVNAHDILREAARHMQDRAATYDSPGGERSMAATVAAFNAISGAEITEEQGWLFMLVLKLVRANARRGVHRDSLEDAVAYASLMAEAAMRDGREDTGTEEGAHAR